MRRFSLTKMNNFRALARRVETRAWIAKFYAQKRLNAEKFTLVRQLEHENIRFSNGTDFDRVRADRAFALCDRD